MIAFAGWPRFSQDLLREEPELRARVFADAAVRTAVLEGFAENCCSGKVTAVTLSLRLTCDRCCERDVDRQNGLVQMRAEV